MSDDAKITLFIKLTASAEKLTVQVTPDTLVTELKDRIAEQCAIAAPDQRVIYRGSILKDERSVGSYGEGICVTIRLAGAAP